jgi:outer membrane protein assembly factor BamA
MAPGVRVRALALRVVLALVAFFACSAQGERAFAAGADAEGSVEVLPRAELPALGASLPPIPPVGDTSALVGKPIVQIDVELGEMDTAGDVEIPSLKDVKTGTPFSGAVARQILQEVLDKGIAGEAQVFAEPSAGGVRVVVAVRPRKVVDSVRVDLHGAEGLEQDDLLRDAELEEGDEILGGTMEARRSRIASYAALRGYPEAKVTLATRETDRRNRVFVIVDVVPGPPRKIDRRTFFAMDAEAKDVEPFTKKYLVKSGDRADEPALDAADADLETRLRSAGWFDARVSHDLVRVGGKIVVLRVRIDAGHRTQLRFEGNDHYDEEALLGALDLEDERDFSPAHLADKVRRFYQKRGWLDVEVVPEMRPGRDRRTVFLVMRVRENRRVTVAQRSYACLREAEVAQLSGGGPTSASAIGREIDSFLDEDLPGADLFAPPDPAVMRDAFDGDVGGQGARPQPPELSPRRVYAAESYEKAVLHVQDLYRNEGYLSAMVGPVQIVRRRCSPASRPGECVPLPSPALPDDACAYDAQSRPLPPPPLDPAFTCRSDPSHGVVCEDKVTLRIPVKLGPRTKLWDMTFTGVTQIDPKRLAKAADLELGAFVSQIKVEDARRRVEAEYKEEGFAYVDVRAVLDKSPDGTRARVRFDVTEGERVIVRRIVVKGAKATRESVIRSRIALFEGQPFRASDVRKTQERIATLNVFSSVTVTLQNPYVPQKNKNVIITVVEGTPQYIEVRPGISTGEGIRGALEYGHRNLFGSAIMGSIRAQASYLPDAFVADPIIKENLALLEAQGGIGARIATRVTGTLAFPQIGLGPLVRGTVDGVFVRDIQRDYALTKGAGILGISYAPFSDVRIGLSQSFELNDAFLYRASSVSDAIAANPGLAYVLRVPSGLTYVVGTRLSASWDRRDNSFNAHRGTFTSVAAEHVMAFPGQKDQRDQCELASTGVDSPEREAARAKCPRGHFLKLTGTLSGYVPFGKKVALALTLRVGWIVQLQAVSQTYPDRLLYMGGFDSMRAYQQDTLIPQDLADRINKGDIKASNVGLRGGNLLVNPRAELRLPLFGAFETVLFGDFGNTWSNPNYPFDTDLGFRVAVGSGIRMQTPVGPLALDYGVNLTRRPSYEDFGALNFSVGLF